MNTFQDIIKQCAKRKVIESVDMEITLELTRDEMENLELLMEMGLYKLETALDRLSATHGERLCSIRS